jgi:hypothetical protein
MSQSVSPRNSAHDIPTAYAAWSPHDMAYSEHFENALHHILEYPPRSRDGITIIPQDSPDHPQPGVSIRARDVDPRSLPIVALQHLPLSVHDPRRIFASPLPGLRLTHPGGYLEGGPGPSPDDQHAYARDFVERNNITHPEQLAMAVQHHMAHSIALAKDRMRARYDAQTHNARIEKEIKTLMDQRDMEVKIETRMKEDAKRRRETRENKRKMAAV